MGFENSPSVYGIQAHQDKAKARTKNVVEG